MGSGKEQRGSEEPQGHEDANAHTRDQGQGKDKDRAGAMAGQPRPNQLLAEP